MGARDHESVELRAVAPLIVAATGELVAPLLLVSSGKVTIAITSASRVQPYSLAQLAIASKLDRSATIKLARWTSARHPAMVMIELADAVPVDHEVTPLPIGNVRASAETRGAPAALVTISATGGALTRDVIPVHVDAIDGGGGPDDVIARLASPIDAAHDDVVADGGVVFAWFPPDPALGRLAEVLAVAMAAPYRAGGFKPRDTAVLGQLLGLDELGHALLSSEEPPPPRPELSQVAGEIVDK
ncbi:MAG: hypothetical protein AB7O24_14325 [Kofleriaceae bacterium]